MADHFEAIRGFVQENFLFGESVQTLGDDDSFLETGVVDSTGILELVQWIEEKFGVSVLDEELLPENFDSISRLNVFLLRKLAA